METKGAMATATGVPVQAPVGVAQPVPEPAAMQTMQVQVPDGIAAGQQFQIMANNQPMMVTANVPGGQMMTLQVPAAAPVAVAQPAPVPVVVAGAAPTVVVQQPVYVAGGPPPGAPEGGSWQMVAFWGPTTWIVFVILLLFFWPGICCITCCKCDQREVYQVGATQYDRNGTIVTDCC